LFYCVMAPTNLLRCGSFSQDCRDGR
jgi:hypothetical protein